jgi:hypothetical protein
MKTKRLAFLPFEGLWASCFGVHPGVPGFSFSVIQKAGRIRKPQSKQLLLFVAWAWQWNAHLEKHIMRI